jgi:hypothetical protein
MPRIKGGNVEGAIGAARVYTGAGAPTVNVTLLGVAGIGDLYSDTTNGKLYICTATNGTSTITWTVVGTQT